MFQTGLEPVTFAWLMNRADVDFTQLKHNLSIISTTL